MKYQNCAAAVQAPDDTFDIAAGLRLSDANIHPETGLATDYLNRFNEAVMLLDMLASCPEFRAEFLAWKPLSYRELRARSPERRAGRVGEPALIARSRVAGACGVLDL